MLGTIIFTIPILIFFAAVAMYFVALGQRKLTWVEGISIFILTPGIPWVIMLLGNMIYNSKGSARLNDSLGFSLLTFFGVLILTSVYAIYYLKKKMNW